VQPTCPTQPVAVHFWRGPQHGLSMLLATQTCAAGHLGILGGRGLHFPRASRSQSREGLRQTSLNDRLSNFEGLALMNIAQGSVLNELS
jgi:hypothetical protein